jgi:thymidylate kinase
MPVGGREQEALATGQCFEESMRGVARGAYEFRHVHLERPGDELVVLLATHLDARSRASELDRVRVDLVVDGREQRVHDAYEEMAAAEPERWRRLRADRDPSEVHAEVLAIVESKASVPA